MVAMAFQDKELVKYLLLLTKTVALGKQPVRINLIQLNVVY